MISHSEERPYTCEICGFNLKTKIQLIKHHQNRHSDERPLKCRYCDWRCKQVSALVCHERTHTNERPYSCSVCRQRFKYLGDKNKHERRHESLGGTGFKRNSKVSHKRLKTEHEGETSASEQDETIIGTIGEVLASSEVDEVQYEEGTIKFETQELTEYETYEQVRFLQNCYFCLRSDKDKSLFCFLSLSTNRSLLCEVTFFDVVRSADCNCCFFMQGSCVGALSILVLHTVLSCKKGCNCESISILFMKMFLCIVLLLFLNVQFIFSYVKRESFNFKFADTII